MNKTLLLVEKLKNSWVEDVKVSDNFILIKFGPKEDILRIQFSNVELNPEDFNACENPLSRACVPKHEG